MLTRARRALLLPPLAQRSARPPARCAARLPTPRPSAAAAVSGGGAEPLPQPAAAEADAAPAAPLAVGAAAAAAEADALPGALESSSAAAADDGAAAAAELPRKGRVKRDPSAEAAPKKERAAKKEKPPPKEKPAKPPPAWKPSRLRRPAPPKDPDVAAAQAAARAAVDARRAARGVFEADSAAREALRDDAARPRWYPLKVLPEKERYAAKALGRLLVSLGRYGDVAFAPCLQTAADVARRAPPVADDAPAEAEEAAEEVTAAAAADAAGAAGAASAAAAPALPGPAAAAAAAPPAPPPPPPPPPPLSAAQLRLEPSTALANSGDAIIEGMILLWAAMDVPLAGALSASSTVLGFEPARREGGGGGGGGGEDELWGGAVPAPATPQLLARVAAAVHEPPVPKAARAPKGPRDRAMRGV